MFTQLGSPAFTGDPVPWNVRGGPRFRCILNAVTLGSLSYHPDAGSEPRLLSVAVPMTDIKSAKARDEAPHLSEHGIVPRLNIVII